MLSPGGAQQTSWCLLAPRISDDPFLVLILMAMFADPVTVDILPCCCVAECELVRGDADDGTVSLVKFALTSV